MARRRYNRRMLTNFRRERFIRQVLRHVARQRVAMKLEPGNVWVVERALPRDDDTEAALATCLLRGWIDHFQDLPTGDLSNLGKPDRMLYDSVKSHYRLTESGWSVINNAQAWIRMGVLIGVLGLGAAFF